MKRNPTDDRPRSLPAPADEAPQVFAVVRAGAGFGLSRRAFLGTAAASAACGPLGGAGRDDERRAGLVGPEVCEDFPAQEIINPLAFRGPDNLLATGGANAGVNLWAVPSGRLVQTLRGQSRDDTGFLNALAFSPDGKAIAGCDHRGIIRFWELPGGAPAGPVATDQPSAIAIAFSPDGKVLVSAHRDRMLRLWAMPGGALAGTLPGHLNPVTCLAMSPDGRWIASGSEDGVLRLWTLPGGEPKVALDAHARAVHAVVFSPDGRLLVSAGSGPDIRIWDLPAAEPTKTIEGAKKGVSALAVGPDSRLLVAGGDDGTIGLWGLPDGRPIEALRGHLRAVHEVAVSPDGQFLASTGFDKTIRLWRLPSGEPLGCLFDETGAKHTRARRVRRMGERRTGVPCDAPLPAGAVCTCDCVKAGAERTVSETVCVCDTVIVSAGKRLPAGTVCVCDTVSVGTREPPAARGSGGTHYSGGHYWHPN